MTATKTEPVLTVTEAAEGYEIAAQLECAPPGVTRMLMTKKL